MRDQPQLSRSLFLRLCAMIVANWVFCPIPTKHIRITLDSKTFLFAATMINSLCRKRRYINTQCGTVFQLKLAQKIFMLFQNHLSPVEMENRVYRKVVWQYIIKLYCVYRCHYFSKRERSTIRGHKLHAGMVHLKIDQRES